MNSGRYLDKIVWVVDDDMPPATATTDAWVREHHQREALRAGLDALGLADDDWCLVTDCDEIPATDVLAALRARGDDSVCALSMRCYYYSFKWRWKDAWAFYPKAAPWSAVRRHGCQALRMAPPAVVLRDGGWHLSYFGNADFVRNKLRNFAHQEFNTDRDLARVEARMREGRNLTDDRFDAVADDALLPRGRALLERLLAGQGAPDAAETAAPDPALLPRLRARVRTSETRRPAPRKKKFAVRKKS